MDPSAVGLPPGPRTSPVWHAAGMALRQRPFLERQRRRYGPVFTLEVAGFGRLIVVSDPALIKQVYTGDPQVLHAGDHSPLRLILGRHSLLGIDEDRHLEQRRLLLPSFKGQRLRAYEELIVETALAEVAAFPTGTPFPVAGAMQRITLRVILRACFGADGQDLRELEELLPRWTHLGSRLATMHVLQRDLGPLSPWGHFKRLRAQVDVVCDRLIAKAKADPDLADRPDVLAVLVQATHTDGSPTTNEEIRDQLVTMLAAGHETTAHQLAWAVERLARHPDALERLVAEVDTGAGKAYRDATIREVQRARPTIPFTSRYTMSPYRLAEWTIPRGNYIAQAAMLTHYDPALFEHPERFTPERFLQSKPDTYTWIPFGGGLRRCIGATFAHMELDLVLKTMLEHVRILPTDAPDEGWTFRGVAIAPSRGGRVVVERRTPAPARATAAPEPALAA